MHHCSIAARKQMKPMLQGDGWYKHGGRWEQWPLVTRLPAFKEPWLDYTLDDARNEFPKADNPLEEYFKHIARLYEGQVVLVGEKSWEKIREGTLAVGDDPRLRDARLWHPQFARTRAQADTLSGLRQNQQGMVDESVDLRKQVGDTMILRWSESSDGPECLRGAALTLPMLWYALGHFFSARELLLFYLNCPMVVGSRPHAWGSKDVKDAACARKKIYGHWGHMMKTSKRKGP